VRNVEFPVYTNFILHEQVAVKVRSGSGGQRIQIRFSFAGESEKIQFIKLKPL
jgi:hypothetical protein